MPIHVAAKQLIKERRQLTLPPYVLSRTLRVSKRRIHRDDEVVIPVETTRDLRFGRGGSAT
jgi:hypothetical protein